MSEKNLISRKFYEELLVKKAQLDKDMAEVLEAIDAARRQGDLSENADYDAARKRQAEINGEQVKTNAILGNYELIEDVDKTGRANLGKTLTVEYLGDDFEDDEEREVRVQILGSLEADIFKNIISNESPLGKVIIDAKVGEKVSFRLDSGDIFYVKILKIEA